MKYNCSLCNKEFSQKSNYDVHCNRKFKCVVTNDYIYCNKILPQNTAILPQNTTILPQNTTILQQNNILNNQIVNSNNNNTNELICKYCNKKYSRKDVLIRHINLYCKEKFKHNNDNKIVEQLLEETKEINEILNKLKEENKELKQLSIGKSSKINTSKNINNVQTNSHNTTNVNSNNNIANIQNNNFTGIGEIGLDYYHKKGTNKQQEEVFRRFLSIAEDTNCHVIIHSRDAKEDTLNILKDYINRH